MSTDYGESAITLAFWECGHVEIDRGKEHACPLDVCSAQYRRYVPEAASLYIHERVDVRGFASLFDD